MQPQYVYNALVTNVVDGDTIDATVYLGFYVAASIRFRLKGINTPEMNDSDPVIREAAQRAKKRVQDLILNKQVSLRSFKTDKYGRWLADIYLDQNSTINNLLINEGLAVAYTG